MHISMKVKDIFYRLFKRLIIVKKILMNGNLALVHE